MVDIRIKDLPVEASPVASEAVAIDGSSTRQTTIQKLVDSGAPVASQAEAEAGVNNVKRMTALTTKQAFDAYAPIGFLRASLNLSDIPDDAAARTNLGLGGSAVLNVGTTAGTVAAGDDARVIRGGSSVQTVTTKAAIAALDPATTKSAALSVDDIFYWSSANLASWVTRDPTKSVLIPPASDLTGASGAWVRQGPWQLGTVYATWFGVKADSDGTAGNGTDNAAAIQAAIDFIAPFVWKGTTRLTELQGAASGTVIFPKGIIRFASKIKAAPNLVLKGQGCGNDFTVRTGVAGVASGLERLGTALFADISSFSTYAIDTCPYDNTGVRLNNVTQLGSDSFNGLRTQVPNFHIQSMTIYGNWTCKGINMAGAESSSLDADVLIRGFTVGVRYSATWYGKCAARILASWRGIICYLAATDVDISGCSLWRPVEAPVYDPTVSGWDGTEPATDSWWTVVVKKRSAGIYNFYGNIAGFNVACELFDYIFMSNNAVNDIRGIYTENAVHGIIFSGGPDQQHENYEFDTVITSTAPLLFMKDSRMRVKVLHHNYSQNGYSKVIGDLINTLGREGIPVLDGVKLTVSDVFTDQSINYGGLSQSQGSWTPTPKFGGANADTGAGVKNGRWLRNGNIVTLFGHITIPTLTANTGAFTIDGLPLRVRNFFGHDAPVNIAFTFATPAIAKGRAEAGGYVLKFDGITNTGFSNGADIRFQVSYETDEGGPWGW